MRREQIRSWVMFLRSHLKFYRSLKRITSGSIPGFYKHLGQVEMLRKLTEGEFSKRKPGITKALVETVRNLEGEYVETERSTGRD
jgi:hypothetical protein